MSAKIGTAPAQITALAVAMNVKLGTITSSPGPIPAATRQANKAVVPTTTAQNQKITATLAKFVELFKLKHL